jgi:ribose transport system ATP-binding protein
MSECPPRVVMANISKSFGGVQALRDVSITIRKGEIHVLVGENGAGKSTLMKILAGSYRKDRGEIFIDDVKVNIANPHIGRHLGIGIIYQEFALAPDLTVAENVFLGRLRSRNGFVRWKEMHDETKALIEDLGFDVDPRAKVGGLSVAFQQVVEIAKALSEKVKILILDEPTAVLAPHEVEQLFVILKKLKEQGVSIIYISHRLEEIFRIADTVTVMKDGSVTANRLPGATNVDEIISLMIGRTLSDMYPARDARIGDPILKVAGLQNGERAKDISFELRSGEVLGIAGMVGSGRTEVARAIFGADRKNAGTVSIDGREAGIGSPRDGVRAGIALVPEDRKKEGVILPMSIRGNITMASLSKVSGLLGGLKRGKEKQIAESLIARLSIRAPGSITPVGQLSGGNQQKVVLAKWFNTECRVIILDEPTRGVDVGAKFEIYTLINRLAKEGLGVIIISSELVELIGMCDRVIVMRGGRMQGSLARPAITEESIMKLAVGATAGTITSKPQGGSHE